MRVSVVMLMICMGGCVQTPYRYEVHDTGEGGVRVDRVPKQPSEIAAETRAPATTSSQTDQQRIDALQAQVQQLSVENQKLKQAATAPVKE